MADYGIQLINDNNYSITSLDDVNFVLRSAGTINNSQFSTGNDLSSADYYSHLFMDLSSFNSPIVFFKSDASNKRVSVLPGKGDFIIPGAITTKSATVLKWYNLDAGSIQYYIFDKYKPTDRSSYGLQIFDSSANIIFDSGWNFLQIKKVVWLDPGYPNHDSSDPQGSNWTNIGQAGSGNLAISIPNPRGWVQNGYTTFGACLYECSHLSGTNNDIYVSLVPRGMYLDQAPSTGWMHSATRSCVIIADVSKMPTSLNPVSIST